ncbi:Carboxylic ester hydrolase [Paramyrothecium foliicola]|nr:Carboxylic ester hydrolase [Paramyrothecium foliicola]
MIVFHLMLLLVPSRAFGRTAPTAKTLNGTYIGRYLPEFDQDLFLGVPFASAPRLDNPQSLNETWQGTRSAEYYRFACWTGFLNESLGLGLNVSRSFDNVNVTIDEECLNLNIIRPAGYDGKAKLPVVVWFHGGGFVSGFGADGSTNTSYLIQSSVKRDVPFIVITLNYRLGFLGFPGGYQSLAAGITNIGLKDQRIALRWINENIAAFGGDPKKVTLWGQSAGAASVAHQILAHNGQGAEKLFRGAIMVSGSPYGTNALYPTHPACVAVYEATLNNTGCWTAENTLDCLRKAPVEAVWRAGAFAPLPSIWTMIDGDFITEPPIYQLQKGKFSRRITIITGANNDEGLLSANYFGPNAENDSDVEKLLKTIFPNARQSTIDQVLNAYPVEAQSPPYSLPMHSRFCDAMRDVNLTCGSQYRRVAAIMGDFSQISGRRIMAEQWAAAGGIVYSYRFDTVPTGLPIVRNSLAPGFATHSAEYTYFFGFPPEYDMLGLNPPVVNISSHLALSKGIGSTFSSFIASGNPNTYKVPYFPRWPAYSVEQPVNMVLNATEINNKLNVRIEKDEWRTLGMNLWKRHPFELQFQSIWRQ